MKTLLSICLLVVFMLGTVDAEARRMYSFRASTTSTPKVYKAPSYSKQYNQSGYRNGLSNAGAFTMLFAGYYLIYSNLEYEEHIPENMNLPDNVSMQGHAPRYNCNESDANDIEEALEYCPTVDIDLSEGCTNMVLSTICNYRKTTDTDGVPTGYKSDSLIFWY